MLKSILSDGLSFASKGALEAAKKLGFPFDNNRFPERNIIESDGTLILSSIQPPVRAQESLSLASKHDKPCLGINLNETPLVEAITDVRKWIIDNDIEVLNIVGHGGPDDHATCMGIIEGVILLDLVGARPEASLTDHETKDYLEKLPVRELALDRAIENIIDDLVEELPLDVRVMVANLEQEDVTILSAVYNRYLERKVGNEYQGDVMTELWKRLRKTHRLRVVK